MSVGNKARKAAKITRESSSQRGIKPSARYKRDGISHAETAFANRSESFGDNCVLQRCSSKVLGPKKS